MLRRHNIRIRGVCVESIRVACTTRTRQCSNGWTTRTFESPESLRYYPYRAFFDFECWFDTARLPSDSDKVHWVARHVPLSISVASNVPGQCAMSRHGWRHRQVGERMMDILRVMSEAAYEKIKNSYEDVLEQLAEAQTDWGERGTLHDHPRMVMTQHYHPKMVMTSMTRNLDGRPIRTKS